MKFSVRANQGSLKDNLETFHGESRGLLEYKWPFLAQDRIGNLCDRVQGVVHELNFCSKYFRLCIGLPSWASFFPQKNKFWAQPPFSE